MTSTIEANKSLVHRYAQAVIDGDMETIEALQHPNVHWWVLGQGTLDRTRFNELVRSGLLAANKRSVRIISITADGDRVAYEAEGEMVFADRIYRNRYHNVLVIRDGLIVEGREYMDTRATAEAFGAAAPSIEFTSVAEGLLLPEGPVAMADGSILLVEVARGTVSRVSPSGAVTVVAELGGGPNGLAIGPDGAVYVCNNGGGIRAHPGDGALHLEFAPELYRGGSIQRVDLGSGAVSTLYTSCDGRPLLAPNDLVFDRQGGLWFTDYGRATASGRDFGGIYYCRTDGSHIVRCIDQQISPNGIGLNAAEDRLYWADSMTARVWVCEIASPGKLARPPSPFMVGVAAYTLPGFQQLDSLAVEANGNVCAATVINGGITVIATDGAMTHYPIADPLVTNICFGGPDLKDAWVTAGMTGRLYRARWPRPGLRLAFNA